jgi:hypothetical protein
VDQEVSLGHIAQYVCVNNHISKNKWSLIEFYVKIQQKITKIHLDQTLKDVRQKFWVMVGTPYVLYYRKIVLDKF